VRVSVCLYVWGVQDFKYSLDTRHRQRQLDNVAGRHLVAKTIWQTL